MEALMCARIYIYKYIHIYIMNTQIDIAEKSYVCIHHIHTYYEYTHMYTHI